MSAEVVSSILSSNFEDSQSSGSWHGGCKKHDEFLFCFECIYAYVIGCLAIAELSQRGCLLPEQVPRVFIFLLDTEFNLLYQHRAFLLFVYIPHHLQNKSPCNKCDKVLNKIRQLMLKP